MKTTGLPLPGKRNRWRRASSIPIGSCCGRRLAELAELPPLVTSWEVESLKSQLAEAQQGRRFLLQGGDCGERFDDCRPDPIAGKLKILLKMSLILVFGRNQRVIRVGRFAGQYAKPRSAADRNPRRRDAAQLPRRSGQSPRLHGRSPHARPAAAAARLRTRRADVELHSRAGRRRLRRPAPSRALGPRFRATRRAVARLPGDRRVGRQRHPLHGDGRRHVDRRIEPRRVLHQPRRAAPRLRAGADPAGAARRQVVQPHHAFPLDRRPHAGDRRRPRRVFPRHRQSDRGEGRPHDDARATDRSGRRSESRERAGPADADPSLRRRPDRRAACRRWSKPFGVGGKPCSGVATRCTATRC